METPRSYSTLEASEKLHISRVRAAQIALEIGVEKIGRSYVWTDKDIKNARTYRYEPGKQGRPKTKK